MSKRTAVRITGFISAATASVGLAAFAVAGTGAYFTDSDSGTISGNLGSISVDGYGGGGENGLDIVFTNMLPGVANSATVKYANDGLNAQDRVLTRVKAALLAAGIDLPYPTRQILLHDQTEETDGDRRRQREGWPAPDGKDPPKPARISTAIRRAEAR